MRNDMNAGKVCSECGRTVTQAEYSSGETNCCHAEVIPEEDFEHQAHDGMCDLARAACRRFVDDRIRRERI